MQPWILTGDDERRSAGTSSRSLLGSLGEEGTTVRQPSALGLPISFDNVYVRLAVDDHTDDQYSDNVEEQDTPLYSAPLAQSLTEQACIAMLLTKVFLIAEGTVFRGFLASPTVTPISSVPM